MKITQRTAKTIGLIVAAAILFALTDRKLPYLDRQADTYFTNTITKAGIAYAVCRAINATVSVIKDSHLEVEPAGVGASLALGQILDPVDDLVERTSDVLITAIVSLGVQKVVYEITVALAPGVMACLLVGLALFALIDHDRARRLSLMISKLLVVVLVARLCLPVSSIVNAFLNDRFFAPAIAKARADLSIGAPEVDKLKDTPSTVPELSGAWGFVKEKATDLTAALSSIRRNMGRIVESLLQLTWLYVGLFLVQVVILPVATFWGLVKFIGLLFSRTELDSLDPARLRSRASA